MVQAEVADRMSAPPGSRTYGVPSVKMAWFAGVRKAGQVPRTVFWPVPRVDSGLVAFTRREPQPGAGRDEVFAVVDAAFAQRRHLDVKDVQPVVKIFAKSAQLHFTGQVLVRRRQHARRHLDRLVRSDRQHFLLFDGPQQLGLGGRRQFADLVQKDRAARGTLETAGLLAIGAGEGASLVAE